MAEYFSFVDEKIILSFKKNINIFKLDEIRNFFILFNYCLKKFKRKHFNQNYGIFLWEFDCITYL
jgi:hypothetical protein